MIPRPIPRQIRDKFQKLYPIHVRQSEPKSTDALSALRDQKTWKADSALYKAKAKDPAFGRVCVTTTYQCIACYVWDILNSALRAKVVYFTITFTTRLNNISGT